MFSRPAPTEGREPLGKFTSCWLIPIPTTEEPPPWSAAVCQRRWKPRGTLTQGSADEVQLVYVGLARPQGDPGQQLREDAADGPDVHGRAVLRVAHQQLRGAVPPGGHVVRVVIARPSWGGIREEGNKKQCGIRARQTRCKQLHMLGQQQEHLLDREELQEWDESSAASRTQLGNI